MKVMLVSQDVRNPTGVATICQSLIEDIDVEWIQLGCVSSMAENLNVVGEDVQWKSGCCGQNSVKVFAVSDHGSEDVFSQLVESERPDVVIFFDDPFRWKWLLSLDLSKKQYSLLYYFVWDNLPDPLFITPLLNLFDEILCISALSFGICNRLPISDIVKVSYLSFWTNAEAGRKGDGGGVGHRTYHASHRSDWGTVTTVGIEQPTTTTVGRSMWHTPDDISPAAELQSLGAEVRPPTWVKHLGRDYR